ncbi:MAG: phage tail protein [Hyphomicrobiaceae bacterium]
MSDDIHPAWRFLVTLDPADAFVPRELMTTALELAPGAFQSATGLGAELEVTAYPEGGRNDYVHQLPVRHSWSRIRLTRGIARDAQLWAWYEAGLTGSLGARRDGAIIMLNAAGQPAMLWTFRAGLAARWSGPELHAQEDRLAIESLEIAHHGLASLPIPQLPGPLAGPALPGF